MVDAARVGKPAIQQIWKSALRTIAPLARRVVGTRSTVSHPPSKKSGTRWNASLPCALALLLSAGAARGTDFHIATAQDLQNALTLAAANGADDLLYLTNGYYVGNFNFNSAEARNLTLLPEPGLTNTDITLDGAGGGRALNLSSSASTNTITVQGITFLRNCGKSV